MKNLFKKINYKNDNIIIRSIFLGNSCVGKTSFIKYIKGEQSKNYISTIGMDSLFLQVCINKENAYMQIFDTCGQERYRSISKNHLKNVDAILLFYDVTDRESFESLNYWINTINDSIDLKKVSLILVANKIDENGKRNISKNEGLKMADNYGIKYFECCCLNGLNIYEILNELILEGYCKNCETQVNVGQSLNDMNIKEENIIQSYCSNC